MSYPQSTAYKDDEKALARFARALGHPARIAILNHLASMPTCCFGDIDKELPIAKSTLSQHLTELKNAGLIQGSIEPPKVMYCIDPANWLLARKLFENFLKQDINKTC